VIGKLLNDEAAFDALLKPYRIRADRIMVGVNLFLMVICIGLIPMHSTLLEFLVIAVPTMLMSLWLQKYHSGALATRLFISSGFMIFTGLIIHQSAGDIEAHFSAFGLIGVLLYYRDWRTIVLATVVIYLHHLILGYAQTLGVSIYVFDNDKFWITFLIHVAYFLPFIGMMVYLSIWLRREGFQDQHVIELAQKIIQGSLVEDDDLLQGEEGKMPLIRAVRLMKSRLLDLLRVMPVAAVVIRLDTGRVVSTNEAWKKTIGPFNSTDSIISKSSIWSDSDTWEQILRRLYDAKDNFLNKIEVVLHKVDGTPIICELSLVLHDGVDPVMVILTVEDITLRREAEETMLRLAYQDMLTGLPNRLSFKAAQEIAFNAWQEAGTPFAVIMLDLDGFKPINDTYGHDVGDEVLRVVGARIKNVNRTLDVAARLGGDEFSVVLNNCPDEGDASQVAQRFIDKISHPIILRDTKVTINVGVSVGVAHISNSGKSAEEVLKYADIALYEAKSAGKNCFCIFSSEGM